MKEKLYIEYRFYFDPKANQDALHEMAAQFQEHVYDLWNNDNEHGAVLDVNDITYEVKREVVMNCRVCLEPQHCACICSTCTAARRHYQEANETVVKTLTPGYRFDFQTGKVTELPLEEQEPLAEKKLSHNEKLQRAADAGRDTWDDYRGEK